MKVFKEEQRFAQTWLILILTFSNLLIVGIMLNEFTKENSSLNIETLIITISLILLFTTPILFFKLITKIDEKGIHYQFFPLQWKLKLIQWNEINSAYVRNYDPIGEYGGWGLKGGALWRKSKGKAINVSGDIGIQLELKNGKKLLIGTQLKTDAENVLKTYKQKLNYE